MNNQQNFNHSYSVNQNENHGPQALFLQDNKPKRDLTCNNNENNNDQSKVRIIEHIRKNLTLFETNREIYEVSPKYENRGHLQAILNQKQQQQIKRSFNDQYTQYRPSDLDTTYTKVIDQHNNTTVGNLQKISKSNIKNNKTDYINKSSLDKFIKRPIELIKGGIKQRKSLVEKSENKPATDNKNSATKVYQQQLLTEGQYKVPISSSSASSKQESQNKEHNNNNSYSTSQSLYLLPAPDYTVHIATKLVKDIILAHKRAEEKSKLNNQGSTLRGAGKLLIKQFFTGTYNSIRRSNTKSSSLRPSLFSSNSNSNSNLNNFRKRSKSFTLKRNRQNNSDPTSRASTRGNKVREATLDHSVSRIKAKVKMPSGKTDKATIIDNKDGTVKISYEPKEIGQHEISLRYNDEPIDESPIVFYVDAVGTSKKKITAYGSGLTHGLVGDQCKFTINTGGLGSTKLNVTVDGPSKTQVNLQDNKDGTITVNYVPLTPGEYKIKISFDGKQVIGSPFTTIIGDEGRQRSRINVGRGSEHRLDLKINEEDLKTIDAVIITPCGLEEPCGLKLLPKANNQLAIVFTPREQGEHLVNVRRRGNHIGGSPFKFDVLSRDIGDAKQVKISGKGLKEGKTNVENEIIINTKEAGYGGLSVSLEGSGRSEIVSKETNVVDGTIKLAYKAFEPGVYSLIVKYADHIVPGSPFSIKVTGQGSNNQKESMRKFRKLATISDVNQEANFSFKLPGVSAYDLSARVNSPQGNIEDASIKDLGDYIYQVSFVPKELGLYSLSIRNKDIHIDGSPFPYTVGPFNNNDIGPHKVRCGGPGLIRGGCGNKLNEFNIFTREAGAGELLVLIDGPSKADIKYTDRKDGSCHVGYKVQEPGEYRISVLFNEQEVPESPFRAYIMPITGEASKIELGPLPPDSMIQLNKPCNMTVIMNGAKGNIEGKVRLPSGVMEDCFASPIDAENWGVRFIPRELGVHQVHIKFNKGSTHIPQSPFNIRVGHDNADPASVLAHGHGLKQATVNHATDFTIETCNAGHALLEVNIEGPSKVSMACAEIDEGYKINYTPLVGGDYLITIKYNGCHIGGSPFKIRALKAPGSRTIADSGAHEISSLSIATTDREAKQKVENMPKFKSDASRVYCKGMGLKKAFAGKPNTLTVNCSEAGFNMIYASFLGPTRNTIHECSVKHMGGSIYEVKYTCKDRGDAILVVKYGDEQIPGSPFRLECV